MRGMTNAPQQSNAVEEHANDKENPHGVTKTQVGLGNVPNVATNDQTPTFSQASTLANIASGEKLSVIFGKVMKGMADLISHIGNKSNPHGVTAAQVGAATSSHASQHAADGSDPITPAQIGAVSAGVLGSTITAFAEVGSANGVVVYATMCLKRLTKTKCDFHISYKIESNPQNDGALWQLMSGEKIRAALGLRSLTADARQSQLVFKLTAVLSGTDLSIGYPNATPGLGGYSGYLAALYPDGVEIGRFYNTSGSFGSLPMTDGAFTPGTFGQISWYGANYAL